MSPKRAGGLALLVVFAGCTGVSPGDAGTTDAPSATTEQPIDDPMTHDETSTDQTTEPHTGVGTSHTSEHLTVRAGVEVQNVTVTLAPNGDSETHHLDAGGQRDLTRDIHDRGHDVTVVVERGNETVFDQTVLGYEYYEIAVYENDTSVQHAMV